MQLTFGKMADDEKEFWQKIAGHLYELRKRTDLTQHDLAKLIGKSRSSVANMETGRQRITVYDLRLLEDILEKHRRY